MSAFDKIIGYDHIKAELMQISDMIHHPEVYAALDAKLPQGLLLSGAPGLGKTLMATALMEDSGLPCFTVRRSQSEDEFLKQLAHTFDEAAEAAPSMLLLDDMDKFSSDEFSTAAFTAAQSCIDKVQEKRVFVIATVNNVKEIPDSLLRCGRFDRQIKVQRPNCTDGEQIIRRYGYDVKWEPHQKYITYTTPENIRCRDSKLFDQTLKRENMELYFRLGGADYLQACREIAYDHREPTPTLEDAVCGMAGTVAAICALCEDENSEVSDLARELYYSSLLLQELVEWYQSRRQERENYEEEYEQYHGFDMTMM